MPASKHVRSAGGETFLLAPDGTEVRLSGVQRMHFYRLAGATPEEATDEQVERYFALKAQEETGQRATPVRKSESAAEMVTRELRILNLPQVLEGGQGEVESRGSPTAPPGTPVRGSPTGSGLGPPPRYSPQAAAGPPGQPRSRFLRRAGPLLYLQTPDGAEQRVTQYMRVHFNHMLEKEITEATDEEIERWWKLQGALEPGATLPEAQAQRLLTEALQAAGRLQRPELETLHQTISAWLEARHEESSR